MPLRALQPPGADGRLVSFEVLDGKAYREVGGPWLVALGREGGVGTLPRSDGLVDLRTPPRSLGKTFEVSGFEVRRLERAQKVVRVGPRLARDGVASVLEVGDSIGH
jgi:hypothetical protein